jgi:hypothetical protein
MEEIMEQVVAYYLVSVYCMEDMSNYAGIQATILSSSDWYGFLMVLPDGQVCLVHSLGCYNSRLGRSSQAHGCIFGLMGALRLGSNCPQE